MNPSLRRRLLLYLISTTVLVWAAAAILSYNDSRHEVEELFDAQLVQSAKALLLLSSHELYEQLAFESQQDDGHGHSLAEQIVTGAHKYEQSVAFQIWINRERLAVRSSSAPIGHMSHKLNGFSDETLGGKQWRVYSIEDPKGNLLIHVGEQYDRREQLSASITLRLLTSVLLALPVMAAVIWFAIGRAMVPLNRIAAEMGARSLDRLEHLDVEPVPEEAKPLVDALNSLFDRLQAAVENERRFTADAAHELRTPLAALKTQTQVAMTVTNEPEHHEALLQVIAGVDRATHLVEQLLTLARLDPDSAKLKSAQFLPVQLCDVTSYILGELAPQAIDRSIELSLCEPCNGSVIGNETMLSIMIRNLAENAIRYTPTGGSVEVDIRKQDNRVILAVADSGPGIPPDKREKVFKRFYRQLGSDVTGSGLGLSIVQRILEIHGADIRLDTSDLGGLLVEVTFVGASTA
jgi:two-component system sensor histidine kinase QseC